MKISCKKETLLNNINIVIKAVASKTTMPILECILITADSNGFRLIANDLEMGIETKNINATIFEKGSVALEAKIFHEIIRNLPEEDLTLSVDEKNVTVINCGNAEFKILGKDSKEFPLISEFEKNDEYEINAVALKNMIKQTIFSVSNDETKRVFTGELIDIKSNNFNLVSVDGFRASFREYKLHTEMNNIKAIVIAKALSEVSRIINDNSESNAKIYFSDKQALFELDNCTIVARLLDGEFLKYETLFNDNFTTKIKIKRVPFLRCLERASLISNDDKKTPIKIEIKQDDKVEISSNTEMGESYEDIEAETEGENLIIGFNPKYLIDALRPIEEEEVVIQFLTPLSPCIIKGINDDSNYKYLIVPLKLKND